jgi:hypothetical protein
MQERIEKNEPTASAGATAVDTASNFFFLDAKNKRAAKSNIPMGK